MSKLKLGAIVDERPVKLTVELPARLHRDLLAYAEVLARETGQAMPAPSKLIAAMLARFMATDRAFRKARHAVQAAGDGLALSEKRRKAHRRLGYHCLPRKVKKLKR